VQNKKDLKEQMNSMDVYTDDMTFNTFAEQKKKDIKVL